MMVVLGSFQPHTHRFPCEHHLMVCAHVCKHVTCIRVLKLLTSTSNGNDLVGESVGSFATRFVSHVYIDSCTFEELCIHFYNAHTCIYTYTYAYAYTNTNTYTYIYKSTQHIFTYRMYLYQCRDRYIDRCLRSMQVGVLKSYRFPWRIPPRSLGCHATRTAGVQAVPSRDLQFANGFEVLPRSGSESDLMKVG